MKKSFVVRIDEDIYKLLEHWAHDEFRSVNGQIEYVINQALVHAGRNKKVMENECDKGRANEE